MASSSANGNWLSLTTASDVPTQATHTASAIDNVTNQIQHVYGVTYFFNTNSPCPGTLVAVYNNVTAANKFAARILREKVPDWRDYPLEEISYEGPPSNKDRMTVFYDAYGAVDYQIHLHTMTGWVAHHVRVQKRTVQSEFTTDDDDSDFPYLNPVLYAKGRDDGNRSMNEAAEKKQIEDIS